MKQFLGKVAVGAMVLAMLVVAGPASAQEEKKLDLGVGYQWLHAPEQAYPFGLALDVAGTLTGKVQWVADIGWSKDTESLLGIDAKLTALALGGGVRYAFEGASAEPFVQVLAGIHRDAVSVDAGVLGNLADESTTNFMLKPGVGIAVPVGKKWGLFGQADWFRIFYEGEGENDFALIVGARLNLK